jgi:histidinol-phosphate/aromatic aminotransferase/cobyric acid decarboxylase-like protein
MVITDHYFAAFYKWFADDLAGKSHREIMARRLRGYYEARNVGEKLGFTVLPSSANFIFAAPNFCGGAEYLEALRERNILVRHWKSERIRDYVRITVGTQQQMQTLISVTKELMK